MAAARGTAAHNSAEYCFSRPLNASPEQQLKNATAGNVGEDGLYRAPKAVTKWALGKSHSRGSSGALERIRFCSRAPRLDPGSRNRAFIASNSAPSTPLASLERVMHWSILDGEGPFIVDWKTTGKSIHKSNRVSTPQLPPPDWSVFLNAELPHRHRWSRSEAL